MPNLLFFVVTIILVTRLSAQDFLWIAPGGGAKSDKTRGVHLDPAGNTLLTGEADGPLTFKGAASSGGGGTDCFVAKVSPQGEYLWVRNLGGRLVDRGYAIASDAAGNVYVTGHHQSTDARPQGGSGAALANAGDYDVFVAKYTPEGDPLWIRTAGGTGYDYGHGIAIDSKGAAVVTGAVSGTVQFGDTVLSGTRSIFCAKYDSEGQLAWVTGSEGRASCSGHGIAIDASDNIYLGGFTSGSGSLGGHPLLAGRETHGLVVKLSPAGSVEWVTLVPGSPSALFHEITVAPNGNVWAAGIFKGRLQAGGETWTTKDLKDSDGWLAHLDPQGKLQWVRVLQGPGTDYLLGVAAVGMTGVLVTGEHSPGAAFLGHTLSSPARTSVLVAAFDGKGTLQWHATAGGAKPSNAYSIATDGKGSVVFGGAAAAPALFGGQALNTSQGADLYVVKMKIP